MGLPTRPVISGFHPDPTVCRVGDRYWLATSSFEYAPGVPIFTSTDLRSWQQVGNAFERPDQLRIEGARASGGIYAPTLRHHDGRFWLITTDASGAPGQLLITADDPAGPWSVPTHVPDAHGIDPDLVWDDNGKCWLTWAGLDPAGRHAIMQAELDTTTGSLLSAPSVLWFGTGGQYPEGPHLYSRGRYWYLVIAEGGTERGHAATVARATSLHGPFESAPRNPWITSRSTDLPVQNTGHADLVEGADGGWAAVFLGVRARGSTPGWHVLGRETFAATVEWRDGWPRIADPLEPPPVAPFVEALAERMPPTWVAPSAWPAQVLRHSEDGWRLTGPVGHPTFVGRRQEHLHIRLQAILEPLPGASGGIEVRIDPWHRMTLWFDGTLVRAVLTVGGVAVVLGEAGASSEGMLEISAEDAAGEPGTTRVGPDSVVARVHGRDGVQEIARVDGRYISTEVAGGFTGRMVGLVAQDGEVRIRAFTYWGHDQVAG